MADPDINTVTCGPRKMTVTPMLRPKPVTTEEVQGWCRDSMGRGPVPSAEHLAPFIALLRRDHQFHLHVKRATEATVSALAAPGAAGKGLPSRGAAGKAIDHAIALRTALDELSVLGDGFWVGLG